MSDKSFIFLPDIHIGFEHVFDALNSRWRYQPTHDEKFIKKVFTFIQDLAPTHVIFGGDQFDFSSISRFNKDSKVAAVGEALEKEYLEWERIFGKDLTNIPTPHQPTWLIGNHDDRTTEFTSKYPQLTGLIDPVKYLKLKDLGVVVKNRGELYNLGNYGSLMATRSAPQEMLQKTPHCIIIVISALVTSTPYEVTPFTVP
jgi:metallophosphoesterase superfamily enzyme